MFMIKYVLHVMILCFMILLIGESLSFAEGKDNRYPIEIKSTYTGVIRQVNTTSNIFNNKKKQELFKKSMKHFDTITLSKGHYAWKPNDDGFHGSRGMQWFVEADFNKNIVLLGITVSTSTTRLQGPVGIRELEISTPYGSDKFYIQSPNSKYSSSMGYSDSGILYPNTTNLNARMANILTCMLKSEPKQTIWTVYGVYQSGGNYFSKADIRGMMDVVELFEILTL